MESNLNLNPYAPPLVDSELQLDGGLSDDLFPATRSARFGAAWLDGIVYLPAIILALVVGLALNLDLEKDIGMFSLIGLVAALPVAIYNWTLIARTGQSLGKRWTRLKVVKVDGSPVDFVSG